MAVGVGVGAPFLEMQTLEDISQLGVRFSGCQEQPRKYRRRLTWLPRVGRSYPHGWEGIWRLHYNIYFSKSMSLEARELGCLPVSGM